MIALQESPRTGTDKTALVFQVSHTPGSLADVLNVFKSNKVNLTWIESFPYREAKGEYVFFVDFEGHAEDPKVKKTVKSLEGICDSVTALGSYPISATSEE